jgi:hypothetical protein
MCVSKQNKDKSTHDLANGKGAHGAHQHNIFLALLLVKHALPPTP